MEGAGDNQPGDNANEGPVPHDGEHVGGQQQETQQILPVRQEERPQQREAQHQGGKISILVGVLAVLVAAIAVWYMYSIPVRYMYSIPVPHVPAEPDNEREVDNDNEHEHELDNKRDEVSILVMGRAGTGKQTLIDGLYDKKKVTNCVSSLPIAASCSMYHNADMSASILKWDLPSKEKMEDAVSSLGSVLETTDLVLFALRMDDARFRPEDEQMMQDMSRQFGDSAWTKVSFVLTHADLVRGLDQQQNEIYTPEFRIKRGKQLEKRARMILREANISELVIEKIPFLPTGLPTKDKLIGDKVPWMSNLVKCVANRAGGKVKTTFVETVKSSVKIYKTVKCNYA